MKLREKVTEVEKQKTPKRKYTYRVSDDVAQGGPLRIGQTLVARSQRHNLHLTLTMALSLNQALIFSMSLTVSFRMCALRVFMYLRLSIGISICAYSSQYLLQNPRNLFQDHSGKLQARFGFVLSPVQYQQAPSIRCHVVCPCCLTYCTCPVRPNDWSPNDIEDSCVPWQWCLQTCWHWYSGVASTALPC